MVKNVLIVILFIKIIEVLHLKVSEDIHQKTKDYLTLVRIHGETKIIFKDYF